MKTFQFLVCLMSAYFLPFSIAAQSVYEAQFGNPQVNCAVSQFCVTLQLKAQTGQPEFAIGSHTLFFNYNRNLINNPVYQTIHFNHLDSCALGGVFAPYFTPSYSYDPTTGEFNLTTNMILPNAGCPVITDSEWVDVGTVCFEIINTDLTTQLSFNATLTLLNLNDNTPQHIQGSLFELDTLINCPVVTDSDGDGLTDEEELLLGTEVLIPDTDGDGLLDGEEVTVYGTNALNPDSDDDNLTDGEEISETGTNPLQSDSDLDGLSDGEEVLTFGTNPLNADSDSDDLTDGDEVNLFGTNPLLADTDTDGLSDGAEVLIHSTNPLNEDTDSDNLSDFDEIFVYNSNPLIADTDNDGLNDGDEVAIHTTNPLNQDTDGDGLTDGDEVNVYGTNPLIADTDNDGLNDGEEVTIHTTNPLNEDTDGDGLSDGDEVNIHGTDPLVFNFYPGISAADSKMATISVFPNPVYTQLNILIPDEFKGKTIELTILFMDGKIAAKETKQAMNTLIQLSLQLLPKGNYVLQASFNDAKFGVAKFTKQ